MKSKRIQELDALRGIAALMVVLFHYTMSREQALLGFKYGTTGVDLFFMISGFVIIMSLSKINSAKQFLINRFSRLYPTYWTVVTFTFIVRCVYFSETNGFTVSDYIANLTMFQMYFDVRDIDGPYWTMVLEMLFYLVLLMFFIFKLINNIRIIGFILVLTIVVLNGFFDNSTSIVNFFYYFPLAQFFPLFYVGILFYQLYESDNQARKQKIINYVLIISSFIAQVYLFNNNGRSRHYISQHEYAVILGCFFFLFTLFINNKLTFIINPITLFLGKISFALYLIHQLISIKIIIPSLMNDFNFSFWQAAIFVALPVVIILAAIITYFIEIPAGKLLKTKLNQLSFNGETKKSSRHIYLSSMVIGLALLVFFALNDKKVERNSIQTADWEVIDSLTFSQLEQYSLFTTSVNYDSVKIDEYWENVNSIPEAGVANNRIGFIGETNEYGLTYKTKVFPELKGKPKTLLFKSNFFISDSDDFLLVVSVEDENNMLLYEFIPINKLLIKPNLWQNVYFKLKLPRITSDNYKFTLHILNNFSSNIIMDDVKLLIVE